MALSNHNGTWTLTQAEYQKLKSDSRELAALEAAGVDNWEGYGEAMRSLEGEDDAQADH